ncbi:hypothetical protein [Cupriavidus basilensis]|uniref:hypothetical protein n=1 Tax=Cupriavidus basilensis TaxID=68895 RepID=UPI0023E77339|nr:hypothetical protein [Cupriavidus basilensis]MDF3886723.1 hypothetical protein [Cupriavidus basilensis]
MQMRPSLNIRDLFPPRNYVEAWQEENSEGQLDISFDTWLERRLSEARPEPATAPNAVVVRQDFIEFELAHSGRYEVYSAARGVRHFRCLLDGKFPWIAFLNPQIGQQYPWVTLNALFSLDELKTIRRVA